MPGSNNDGGQRFVVSTFGRTSVNSNGILDPIIQIMQTFQGREMQFYCFPEKNIL